MSVAVMGDEQHGMPYHSSPPTTWGQTTHVYPHSHHGTPAQEYAGFNFELPQPAPVDPNTFPLSYQQRPTLQQLQPLVMPQWPSMLNNQSHSTFAPLYPQPVQPSQPMQLPTPISAGGSRSATTPRKTLTDADRRRMCQYAEENPTAKQTEIGTRFGVERSTVSKVLRQKEKFLLQDDGSRSPVKRAKGRSPDIERALAVWAKNQERKGLPLTNDLIREKAQAFSTTSSSPDSQPVFGASWIEKFKLNNNLLGARSRKSSLAPDDADAIPGVRSSGPTPSGTSPVSPHGLGSQSPAVLHSVQSQESLKTRSPDSYHELASRGALHSQSHTSLKSAFTDTAPSSFSPGPLSPTSPFFTPDSGTAPGPFMPQLNRPILPATARENSQRPRSQTFPMLDHFMAGLPGSAASDPSTPRYTTSSVLDSPMDDSSDPLLTLNSTLHLMHDNQRPHTVTPAETMGPPPLPSLASREARRSSIGTAITTSSVQMATSPEEARRALEVVLGFFEQQPHGYLDLQESVTIGKLMEKLKLQSHGT
nr:hypothetical protein B0A51_09915 [Rachicladosporium sp. CCFEE 5018]OQO22388.1 hypothetical protein B0A51_10851 [Rachicladosporium sp. CCFEE 5018]